MATIRTKLAIQLHNDFRRHLDFMFFKRFGLRIMTYYSDVQSGLVSIRKDGATLTGEQQLYIEAVTDGYMMVVGLVRQDA